MRQPQAVPRHEDCGQREGGCCRDNGRVKARPPDVGVEHLTYDSTSEENGMGVEAVHPFAALTKVAEARGWQIVAKFSDAGISGAKNREGRPDLDDMLKRAQRRDFDVVMAWAIDRIGRSLVDLLNTIEALKACGVDLYLDQQAIDTTTPAGKLMLQMTGAFAEFERNMIQARIHAGLKRAVAAGKTLGRPLNDPDAIEKAKRALRKGVGINRTAKLVGLSNGTVQRLKDELTGRPFVGVAA
jgi:DNA invertase Pin-like site-specific DNA recombinase